METKVFESSSFINLSKILKRLEYPYLKDGENWWIYDLLFTPGIRRCQLIEWILLKLNFSTLVIPSPEDSHEKCIKYLFSILSDLRLCEQSDKKLVLGEVTCFEQLKFWEKLLFLVWQVETVGSDKSTSNSNECENTSEVSLNSKKSNSIEEQFVNSCNLSKSLTSPGKINGLFGNKLNLLPPDLRKDLVNSSNMSEAKSLLKSQIQESGDEINGFDIKDLSLDSIEKKDLSLTDTEVHTLKGKIKETVKKNSDLSNNFTDLHLKLKPHLKQHKKSTPNAYSKLFEEFHDSYKPLKKVLTHLEATNSCMNNFAGVLKNNQNFDLMNMNFEFQEKLPCSTLWNYIKTLHRMESA